MPRGRYRHAAVAINNQLWLVGGRSLEDALLEDVDVRSFFVVRFWGELGGAAIGCDNP